MHMCFARPQSTTVQSCHTPLTSSHFFGPSLDRRLYPYRHRSRELRLPLFGPLNLVNNRLIDGLMNYRRASLCAATKFKAELDTMSVNSSNNAFDIDPIDIVIPWVDGNDPALIEKRKLFVAATDTQDLPPGEVQQFNLDRRWGKCRSLQAGG